MLNGTSSYEDTTDEDMSVAHAKPGTAVAIGFGRLLRSLPKDASKGKMNLLRRLRATDASAASMQNGSTCRLNASASLLPREVGGSLTHLRSLKSANELMRRPGDLMAVTAMPTLAPSPFEPHAPGTSEALWRSALADRPLWHPTGTRLLVLAPHPDDATLGVGGILAMARSQGKGVEVVTVTDGEAAPVSRTDLRAVRAREQRQALKHLDVGPPVRLGIADGRVARHLDRLRRELDERIVDGTLLLAPYEQDGHPDHDAVGQVAEQVATARGVACARYLIWAWHHRTPAELPITQMHRVALSARVQSAKERALRCFASQLAPTTDPPVVPPHVLAHLCRPYETVLIA